jgi:ribosomal protein S18 acetylase RimI-like enzyme
VTEQPLEVRAATIRDVEAIARVHVEAWQSGYAGLMPADVLGGLDWRERAATWRERLERPSPNIGYLVATRDSVVGFCAFGPARDEDLPAEAVAEIYAINVLSSAWSMGVGSALLLAAVQALSAYDDVVLWVLKENWRARRFYERRGFAPDEASKTHSIGETELPEVRYRLAPGGSATTDTSL